jgi:hypothetical protein
MGLLEEAIREHLELKRQHGADPGEVSAQEREALGPVQRTVEPLVVEEDVVEEDLVEEDLTAPEEVPGAIEDRIEPVSDEPAVDHVDEVEPAPSSVELPEEEPPPGEGTAPFDIEDEPFAPERPEPEESEKDEDVLEETPEFLQETPEHDRLWFEQKPPRDFDFDR